jgi:hypothetical protein
MTFVIPCMPQQIINIFSPDVPKIMHSFAHHINAISKMIILKTLIVQ